MTLAPHTTGIWPWRLAMLTFLVVLAVVSSAQPVSQLGGRVIDSTKAVLPGVTVEAVPSRGGKTIVF
jgi:hypothetical protein